MFVDCKAVEKGLITGLPNGSPFLYGCYISSSHLSDMGSDEGGETWAVFSSLIETCKLNDTDPNRYFVWLFDELAKLFKGGSQPVIDYRRFLPWNAPLNCKVDVMVSVSAT